MADKTDTSKIARRKRRSKPRANRVQPCRSIDVWAREALQAFDDPAVRLADLKKIGVDVGTRERRPDSVAKIAKASAKAFGVDLATWVTMSTRSRWLLTMTKDRVRSQLDDLTKILEQPIARVRILVRQEANLLTAGRGVLAKRLKLSAHATGLSVARWRTCVQSCSPLLLITPETIAAHAKQLQTCLGISAAEMADVIARYPRLLQRNPERIAEFITSTAKDWGMPESAIGELVMRTPQFVTDGMGGRLKANIDAMAEGFGVDRQRVIAAVRRYTPLGSRLSAAQVMVAIEKATAILQVDRSVLIDAILRSPSLIGRRIEGMGKRMRLIRRIAAARGVNLSAEEVLTSMPTAMTYGMERLLQRYVVAKLGLWKWNWQTLLSYKDEIIRQRLNEHFRDQPNMRDLKVALQRRGLL